ncbi:MAG TPA: type II toxin-antitoxin system VapC family toxin [Stellaceae bacterium]|nr:type II toxin-antitoxin system VapC family toxin [Stellaceae bacterium]
MSIVVDTSMTVAWLFRDERGEAPRTALRHVITEGATVPTLWRLEVANALRTAVRRRRCTDDYADQCLRRLSRLRITADAETDRNAWGMTRSLSRHHNLTLYDAAYLELAVRLDAVLATMDRAAQEAGLGTIGD